MKKLNKKIMKTIKFYQLDGEQKLDAISQMSTIIVENNFSLPANKKMLEFEIEDFNIKLSENEELTVTLKEFA